MEVLLLVELQARRLTLKRFLSQKWIEQNNVGLPEKRCITRITWTPLSKDELFELFQWNLFDRETTFS